MSGIRRLDDGTISTLRSTLVLHTLPAVLLELVQNSLDADARLIEVSFSLKRWQCRVSDDGTGISAIELKHVGKRYCALQRRHLTLHPDALPCRYVKGRIEWLSCAASQFVRLPRRR